MSGPGELSSSGMAASCSPHTVEESVFNVLLPSWDELCLHSKADCSSPQFLLLLRCPPVFQFLPLSRCPLCSSASRSLDVPCVQEEKLCVPVISCPHTSLPPSPLPFIPPASVIRPFPVPHIDSTHQGHRDSMAHSQQSFSALCYRNGSRANSTFDHFM